MSEATGGGGSSGAKVAVQHPTPVRVGVIGVGGMGACHARNIADLGGAELAWIADPDEEAGRALADELATRWAPEGLDLLDECDAVVIACPDRFHASYTMAALDRRLPILCEKPLTVELDDAVQILDREVSDGRRRVQVGFMREYDQRHIQVAEAARQLGEVRHVRCVHRNTNHSTDHLTKGVVRPVGQILVESVVHDVHSVRWLSGTEITEVTTSAVERDDGPRFVVLTCRLSNGGIAIVEFDDGAAGYEVSVEVSAERGNVVAAEPHRALVRSEGAISAEIGDDWFSPFLETYRVEMRDWLDSLVAGEARGPSTWDAFAAQAVVEAAIRSHRSGRAESVELGERPAIYQEVA